MTTMEAPDDVQNEWERLQERNGEGFHYDRRDGVVSVNFPFLEDRDADFSAILAAMRQDTTLKTVRLDNYVDAIIHSRETLGLASILSDHPTVNRVCFTCTSLNGFAAIALAFHQNRTLTSLRLQNLDVTREYSEQVEWLLSENLVEELDLSSFQHSDLRPNQNNLSLDIAQGLRLNRSLKELVITSDTISRLEPRLPVSHETINAIPHLLRNNRSLQVLKLGWIDIPAEAIVLMAEALEESGHESLHTLAFHAIGEGSSELHRFVALDLPSLKTLNIDFNETVDDASALRIATGLGGNTNLESFSVGGWSSIGDDGARAIAHALMANSTLECLRFRTQHIGRPGISSIAHALTVNSSLTSVSLTCRGNAELQAIVPHLAHFQGLKALGLWEMESRSTADNALTKATLDAFLEALEQNDELEYIGFPLAEYSQIIGETLRRIKLLTNLNAGGRRILKMPSTSVPPSLWPLILEKSSNKPDVLFYFLGQKPDALINNNASQTTDHNGRSRKRKRSSSSETSSCVVL